MALWLDSDGRLYADRSFVFLMSLDSLRQVPSILRLVDWALEAFEQEAIFVNVSGFTEIITPA